MFKNVLEMRLWELGSVRSGFAVIEWQTHKQHIYAFLVRLHFLSLIVHMMRWLVLYLMDDTACVHHVEP